MFDPLIHILPASQLRLWNEFSEVPGEFVLYGGTAVALQLGHRQSVDFDFFSNRPFRPADLYATVPFLAGAEIVQQAANTLTCSVDRDGFVKVSFFGLPKIRRVDAPLIAAVNGLRIASLIDLAGTKAAVVQQRAEAKDYIDLDAILRHGIDLDTCLAAAMHIYGPSFNPALTLKSLCYFGDGDLVRLPGDVKRRLQVAAQNVDVLTLPALNLHGSSPKDGNRP
jgi:hypothetical protein